MSSAPDFNTVYLATYTGSALAWVQTISCVGIIYCYLLFAKKVLWKIILVHAITGFVGLIMENYFIAKKKFAPNENWGLILAFNEVNWILHEASTVLYSLVKLESVLPDKVKKATRVVMVLLFIGFCIFRIEIGYFRSFYNTTNNMDIARAHSYAFIFWGIADIIIFGLLMMNTFKKFNSGTDHTIVIVKSLMQSSIPRIFVLITNTICIVIVGQMYNVQDQQLSNFNSFLWSLKGAYPFILLIDILTTKDLLISGTSKYALSSKTNPRSESKLGGD